MHGVILSVRIGVCKLESLLFKNKILCLFHGFVFRWDLLSAVFFVFLSLFSGHACFRFIALSAFSGSFWRSFRAVLKGFSAFLPLLIVLFERFNFPLLESSAFFYLKSSCLSSGNRYFWRCMNSFYALIAIGLDVFRMAFSKSKFEKTAAAVVVGVVGIGLLASPFLVQANDEEKTNNAPEVSCIWVANHGSLGFDVEFDVSAPSDSDRTLSSFRLCRVGAIIPSDSGPAPSTSLLSPAPDQGWLDIPGYDGSGIPIPYSGYVHSFDYIIKGEQSLIVAFGGSGGLLPVAISSVEISLYVVLNSEGTLESMSAWAVDSDGDSYEVPVYYSGGGPDGPFYIPVIP